MADSPSLQPRSLGKTAVPTPGTPVRVTSDTSIRAHRIRFTVAIGETGRVFLGVAGMNKASGAGVVKEFWPTGAGGGVADELVLESAAGDLVWGTTNTVNAVCIGCVGYSVDRDGCVPRDSVIYDRFTHCEEYAVTEEIAVLAWNGALAAHSLARMNCRNVVLHAIASPKVARRHQRDLVPATVWHEIRITNVPQIRTTGSGVLGRDESKMRRFWVRGHYADNRNGAGLFGNPKLRCVFWIPEHQRGNAELGDVIPEYTLA